MAVSGWWIGPAVPLFENMEFAQYPETFLALDLIWLGLQPLIEAHLDPLAQVSSILH
jgi:hypothetical protein